jgi:starch phosphorylase
VQETKTRGYDPLRFLESNDELAGVIGLLSSGFFANGDPSLFRPLVDSLLSRDEYLLFADFQSYCACQDRVDKVYRDQKVWTRMSILNVARMGRFSSDRSIRDYAKLIWGVKPVKIRID